MKPLNAQERRNQFFIFLLFFVITVAFVVVAVYFNFSNHPRQLKAIKDENANFRKRLKYTDQYLSDVDSLLSQMQLDKLKNKALYDLARSKTTTLNANLDKD